MRPSYLDHTRRSLGKCSSSSVSLEMTFLESMSSPISDCACSVKARSASNSISSTGNLQHSAAYA